MTSEPEFIRYGKRASEPTAVTTPAAYPLDLLDTEQLLGGTLVDGTKLTPEIGKALLLELLREFAPQALVVAAKLLDGAALGLVAHQYFRYGLMEAAAEATFASPQLLLLPDTGTHRLASYVGGPKSRFEKGIDGFPDAAVMTSAGGMSMCSVAELKPEWLRDRGFEQLKKYVAAFERRGVGDRVHLAQESDLKVPRNVAFYSFEFASPGLWLWSINVDIERVRQIVIKFTQAALLLVLAALARILFVASGPLAPAYLSLLVATPEV